MSVAVAFAVGTTYGLYAFGALGSPHTRHCLANQVLYTPKSYNDQTEFMAFLSEPGSEDVTKKFDNIILYGFISNFLYILFHIYKL